MAKYSRNENIKYESQSISLSEIVKSKDFPIVARLSKKSEFAGQCIEENKEVLFQRRLKTKCAQVKILDFNDKENVQEAKGIDFIMEHDNFVGNTYLMPVKYNGTLKFVHRPGSWSRYTSISQVLKDLPRFVLVEEETVSMPLNGIGKVIIIPAKTLLEVVRKFNEHGVTYLQCSDGHDSYAFTEKDRVNFTEVEDEKLYNLFELVRLQLLPKVFQFLDVDSTDIVQMNEELNSGLLTMAWGPMELVRFVDVDMIVAWVRHNKKNTYETLVIPSNLWPFIQLQTRAFSDQKGKRNYIDRKYGHCKDSDFVERSLYVLPVDQFEITWLKSPDLYERNYSGSTMFDVVYVDFQVSSEDDEETTGETSGNFDYPPPLPVSSEDDEETTGEKSGNFDYPPPLPERSTKLTDLQTPTHLHPKVKEKMSLFGKAHKELRNWFFSRHSMTSKKSYESLISPKNVVAAPTSANRRRFLSERNVRDSAGAKHFKRQQICQQSTTFGKIKFPSVESIVTESQYLHAIEKTDRHVKSSENILQVMQTPSLSDVSCISNSTSDASTHSDESDSDSSSSYDYPDFETFNYQSSDSTLKASELTEYFCDMQASLTEAANKGLTDRAVTTSINEPFPKEENLISSVPPQAMREEATSCVLVSNKSDENEISVSRLNCDYIDLVETEQTEDRFFQYSVFETAQCFRECGLGKYADACFENKLDGSFFRNLDLQIMKDDPFDLSNFEVLKVRKIVFEGWRPNSK